MKKCLFYGFLAWLSCNTEAMHPSQNSNPRIEVVELAMGNPNGLFAQEPKIPTDSSLTRTDLGNWITDPNNLVLTGALFADSDENYCYLKTSMFHRLFHWDSLSQTYQKIYETESRVHRLPKFMDCDFDGITDLLISLPTNGNWLSEQEQIVLRKGNKFIEVTETVSFPTFDRRKKSVFSRSLGPNDAFVTVEKYKWNQWELQRDTLLRIPLEEYNLKFGYLNHQ